MTAPRIAHVMLGRLSFITRCVFTHGAHSGLLGPCLSRKARIFPDLPKPRTNTRILLGEMYSSNRDPVAADSPIVRDCDAVDNRFDRCPHAGKYMPHGRRVQMPQRRTDGTLI